MLTVREKFVLGMLVGGFIGLLLGVATVISRW